MMLRLRVTLRLGEPGHGRPLIDGIIDKKTSQFKASCKDSKKLRESWTYKTAKIFSRTRHVRL
jgi:hypothetical protein